MAIVETKIVSRPNTSIPFFNQSNNATLMAKTATIGLTFITNTETYQKSTNASGSHIIERMYSDDLLTQTNKATFDSIETFSTIDSSISIALDREYSVYAEDNGFTHPVNQYSLTGIDAPFACTTTYTYSSNFSDGHFFEIFVGCIEASDKLTSFTNTGTQLIAVHSYTNAADFTKNNWKDFSFVGALYDSGVTRTISYAMI